MGSGKTCICLALILSTLRELPRLEGTPTYFDGSAGSPRPQIMTYLARNFPYDAEMYIAPARAGSLLYADQQRSQARRDNASPAGPASPAAPARHGRY